MDLASWLLQSSTGKPQDNHQISMVADARFALHLEDVGTAALALAKDPPRPAE